MKTFRLQADATFDAEDLDDAFAKLARHFKALDTGEEDIIDFVGHFELGATA